MDKLKSEASPFRDISRLTLQECTDLFTIMAQWARNADLQAQKVAEWFERRTERKVRLAVEATRQHFEDAARNRAVHEGCESKIAARMATLAEKERTK